jgi:hypothetical protein
MTTENVNQEVQDQVVDQVTQDEATESQEPQYSEIELQALDQGWRPKDEYKGDPQKWVNADIFVARAPLFEHMDVQKREIRDLRRALKEVAALQAVDRKESYDHAARQLREAKKTALENSDYDAVMAIDERIDLVKDAQRQSAEKAKNLIVEEAQELHPEFAAWVSRNTWYTSDPAMAAYADAKGRQLASPNKAPSQVLKEIEESIREEFPHKFQNKNRERPGAVERSTSKASSGSNNDSYQLSDLERQIMKTVVATGVMTEKQYIAELKKANS